MYYEAANGHVGNRNAKCSLPVTALWNKMNNLLKAAIEQVALSLRLSMSTCFSMLGIYSHYMWAYCLVISCNVL